MTLWSATLASCTPAPGLASCYNHARKLNLYPITIGFWEFIYDFAFLKANEADSLSDFIINSHEDAQIDKSMLNVRTDKVAA